MIASGICGTDKHTFRGEVEQYPGSETQRGATYPLIQGHENVGIVEAVGEGGAFAGDGTPLEPGDRVVPAPNRACGHCGPCQRGFPYFLCDNLDSYGNALAADVAPYLWGGWSQYLYLKPRTGIFRVPDSLPDDVAVLTEIFAVTHSLERAAQVPRPSGFRPGDSVAVIGVGALGQAHAIKAQLMGAGRVFAIDPSQKRLDVAARVAGAEPADADELRNVDLVVNATGFPGSFGKAIKMVRDGGTIIEVGAFVNMGEETFNPAVLCGRHLTLPGDRRRGPARLRAHARADGPPRGLDPVRRDGLAPLRRRGRARGDGDRARRRALREGPDHRLSASSSARAHHRRVGVDAGPVPDRDHALVDEHPEAVEHRAAARLGVADQPRPRRVADHVGDDHPPDAACRRRAARGRRRRGRGRSRWR